MKKLPQKVKNYLVSSIITFLAAFLSATVPFIDRIDVTHLELSAIFGSFSAVMNVALRAGLKALLEERLRRIIKTE